MNFVSPEQRIERLMRALEKIAALDPKKYPEPIGYSATIKMIAEHALAEAAS